MTTNTDALTVAAWGIAPGAARRANPTYHLRRSTTSRTGQAKCGRLIVPAPDLPEALLVPLGALGTDAPACRSCRAIAAADAAAPAANTARACQVMPLFADGCRLDELAPEATDALLSAAASVARARSGHAPAPALEMDQARQRTGAAADLLCPRLGTRVSRVMVLSLLWWTVEAIASPDAA